MSLPQLFDVFFHRQRAVFLLVTLAVLGAATAMTLSLTKEYRGVATLFVGENRSVQAGADAVQLDDILAQTYARLLKTAQLQRRVAEDPRLPGTTPDELDRAVSVEVVAATRLIEISALDPEPARAQQLANTYAQVFVDVQQENLNRSTRARLDRLNRQIGELATELERIEQATAGAGAARRAQVETELAALRQAFRTTQEGSVQQGSNVSVSSLSTLPTDPAKPRTKLYLALAVVLALLIGAGAALVRNAFDKRVRDEDELSRLLGGVPVLARVPLGRSDKDQRAMNEAFDFLRVNLRLSAADTSVRVIAVTSSLPGDGKSTVSARLARAYAQQGAAVIAADCDLRKPMLANYLEAQTRQGITTVLVTGASPVEMLSDSNILGVRVLPAGPVPPNPSVLLGLPRFRQVIEELRRSADFVVVDTPPVPAGVDTSSVSQVVDGVVLVIDLDRSNRDALEVTRDQLEQANARVLGIVLNRVPDRLGQYGYGYAQDSPLEHSAPPPSPAGPRRARAGTQ